MKHIFHHYFVPHERNNHRSKILHHGSLFVLVVCMLLAAFFIQFLKYSYPSVLGISYSISDTELLTYTNQKRAEQGLGPLTLNPALSAAAAAKAADMYSKNYWAHFAPDGTTPWSFIRNSGYAYVHAGENLAKGFTHSEDVINAWMNSPSHRENMLSSKYNDVGFAIVSGTLLGEDTVLVVELLGSTTAPAPTPQGTKQEQNTPQAAPAQANSPQVVILITPILTLPATQFEPTTLGEAQQNTPAGVSRQPFIDAFLFPKSISIVVISFILLALAIDLIVIERKKIFRFVGHNIDHIILLGFFIATIIFSGSGSIF